MIEFIKIVYILLKTNIVITIFKKVANTLRLKKLLKIK